MSSAPTPLAELFLNEQLHGLVRDHVASNLSVSERLKLSEVSQLFYRTVKGHSFYLATDTEARCLLADNNYPRAGINHLAPHPSLPLIAIGPHGGPVKVWDYVKKEYRLTVPNDDTVFPPNVNSIWAAAATWSPDGNYLATGGWYGQIVIWELATGSLKLMHKVAAKSRSQFAWPGWSGDGCFLATADGAKMQVWPADNQTSAIPVFAKPRHGETNYIINGRILDAEESSDWVEALCGEKTPAKSQSIVASSPDGWYTALGYQHGEISVWEWHTKNLVHHFQDDCGEITALAFSNRCDSIASGNSRGIVTLWSLRTGEPRDRFQGAGGPIASICWSFDDRFTIGCDNKSHQLRLWMVEDRPIDSSIGSVRSCSPDGKRFVVRNRQNCLFVIAKDFVSFGVALIGTENHLLPKGCWSADSNVLVSQDDSCNLYLWNPKTGVNTLLISRYGTVTSIAWDHLGSDFAISVGGARFTHSAVISASNGEMTGCMNAGEFSTSDRYRYHATCVAYNPKLTNRCATATERGGLYLWDSTSPYNDRSPNVTEIKHEPHSINGVTALTWTDSTHLSYATSYGEHIWYDINTQVRKSLGCHWSEITSFALSPDGQQIASSGAEGAVIVWDLTGNFEHHCISGFPAAIEEVVWSSASEIIALGSGHFAVWKWDKTASKATMRYCSSPFRFNFANPTDTKIGQLLDPPLAQQPPHGASQPSGSCLIV